MNPIGEIVLSEHARQRIKERSSLAPETVLERITNGGAHEAHRQNGVSYYVLWSGQDMRPYLAVVQGGIVLSFYYTYEFQRRGDACVILPAHIGLARKALWKLLCIQNAPRYHFCVSWAEISTKGKLHQCVRKLFSCARPEFESFKGPLFAFIGQNPQALASLSKINIPQGCQAMIFVRNSEHEIVASEKLS